MGNIIAKFLKNKSAAAKNKPTRSINNYICTDLVKYVICDYINYDSLIILQDKYNCKKRSLSANTTYLTETVYSITYWDLTKFYKQINVNLQTKTIITQVKEGLKHKIYKNNKLTTTSTTDIYGITHNYKYKYSGKLRKVEKYKDGCLHGIITIYKYSFYSNNYIVYKTKRYKYGLRHGYTFVYDNKGFLTGKIRYKNGLKNGWSIYYNNCGDIYLKIKYADNIEISRKDYTID
jgi:antitoxin component YwqK of YwqJK toxin-antitoxin module